MAAAAPSSRAWWPVVASVLAVLVLLSLAFWFAVPSLAPEFTLRHLPVNDLRLRALASAGHPSYRNDLIALVEWTDADVAAIARRWRDSRDPRTRLAAAEVVRWWTSNMSGGSLTKAALTDAVAALRRDLADAGIDEDARQDLVRMIQGIDREFPVRLTYVMQSDLYRQAAPMGAHGRLADWARQQWFLTAAGASLDTFTASPRYALPGLPNLLPDGRQAAKDILALTRPDAGLDGPDAAMGIRKLFELLDVAGEVDWGGDDASARIDLALREQTEPANEPREEVRIALREGVELLDRRATTEAGRATSREWRAHWLCWLASNQGPTREPSAGVRLAGLRVLVGCLDDEDIDATAARVALIAVARSAGIDVGVAPGAPVGGSRWTGGDFDVVETDAGVIAAARAAVAGISDGNARRAVLALLDADGAPPAVVAERARAADGALRVTYRSDDQVEAVTRLVAAGLADASWSVRVPVAIAVLSRVDAVRTSARSMR